MACCRCEFGYALGVFCKAFQAVSHQANPAKPVRADQAVLQERVLEAEIEIMRLCSRTGIEPNCPRAMHFRIFRRAFTRKIGILLRKISPKSIKNAFALGCEQF